jgi:hypothetical protein
MRRPAPFDDEESPASVDRLVHDLRDHRDLVLAVEDRQLRRHAVSLRPPW